MNLSAPAPTTAPQAASPGAATDCRREAAAGPDARAEFALILQIKGRTPHEEPQGKPSDEAAAAPAWILAPPELARSWAVPVGASAGAVDTPASGTPRAAIQAALNGSPEPAITPLGRAEPAAVWEASVRGAHHLSIDLRAERISTQGAPPSWGLTIGSPTLSAELLARHAPRLNERLRKNGVELDHVRVESFDNDTRR